MDFNENNKSYGFEKLHMKILEIVKEIDKICKKYNIQYFLIDGSALGAVRHQGFIPWDDDFDIGMMEEEYEKFKQAAIKEFQGTKYFYQDIDTDEEYNLTFAKVRDSMTTNLSIQHCKKNINHGIWVDIFPIYSYSESKVRQKLQHHMDSVVYVAESDDNACGKIKYFFVKSLCNIIGKKRLIKSFQYLTRRFHLSSESKRVLLGRCEVVERECFEDVEIVPFENYPLPIPKKYDKFLKTVYGNYMACPTEEQKLAAIHKPLVLDTEKSYLEYIDNKQDFY